MAYTAIQVFFIIGYGISFNFIHLINGANVHYSKVNKGLTEFPNDIPNDVTHLGLRQNQISNFPAEKLFGFVTLYVIDLYLNQLSTFPNFTYVASTLNTLTLSRNKITSIPYSLLDILAKLSYLDLNNNQLTSFPDAPGPGMTLQKLYLGTNKFTTFPSFRYVGHRLVLLYINNNGITEINPDCLSNLTYLYDIHLAQNKLTEMPDLSFVAESLQVLRLQQNQIKNISHDLLNQLTKVRHLELGYNQLNDFPNVPGLNNSLTFLDLSYNLFTKIPDLSIIGGMLSHLYLRNNYLNVTLAENFKGLRRLQILYLQSNIISMFPNLTYIKDTLNQLEINNNNIELIPDELMNILTRLRRLVLSTNLLTKFPNVPGPNNTLTELYLSANKFATIPNLKTIGVSLRIFHITSNMITNIAVEDISFMKSMTNIAFSKNQLTVFPDLRIIGASLSYIYCTDMSTLKSMPPEYLNFHNNSKAMRIYLYRTNVETLPPVVFGLKVYLDLRWNKLICDNSLMWVITDPKVALSASCSKPANLKGRSVTSLQITDAAASKILVGSLEDEFALHDGIVNTCTKILPVKIKYGTSCSPIPSNLLLKLQGEFDLVSDFTTRISVVYFGSSCSMDLSVYHARDTPATCQSFEPLMEWRVNVCPLINSENLSTGATKCTFECDKSLNMYISFYDNMKNGTVCDVSYIKATLN